MLKYEIWFWQQIVSPHMAGLATALAELGHTVIYVASQKMSPDLAAQGWHIPSLDNVALVLAPESAEALELAAKTPPQAVHICQGIRGNGYISQVQRLLATMGRRQWAIMETVDDAGWRGVIKRLEYRRLLSHMAPRLEGMLAIGHRMPDWLLARGAPASKVYAFAYFLPDEKTAPPCTPLIHENQLPYRFLFVGQFIARKRLEILIAALAGLDAKEIELAVIGNGPLENDLRRESEQSLPGRVVWIGGLPMQEIGEQMLRADCLVLPSRHDGWGVVVSEALMAGTPAICSNHCGSMEVVLASQTGGVFAADNIHSLKKLLAEQYATGRQTFEKRKELAAWAACLGASAGATYLTNLLQIADRRAEKPLPPWHC